MIQRYNVSAKVVELLKNRIFFETGFSTDFIIGKTEKYEDRISTTSLMALGKWISTIF